MDPKVAAVVAVGGSVLAFMKKNIHQVSLGCYRYKNAGDNVFLA